MIFIFLDLTEYGLNRTEKITFKTPFVSDKTQNSIAGMWYGT
jgi:hypothetical protein